jgi:hypothetical protein
MATLPGHRWVETGTVKKGRSSFFVYMCLRCPAQTLNGHPLPRRWVERCG